MTHSELNYVETLEQQRNYWRDKYFETHHMFKWSLAMFFMAAFIAIWIAVHFFIIIAK